MSENTQLGPEDFAEILTTTLALAAEAGIMIAVKPVGGTAARSAGILIYLSGLDADSGRIVPRIADVPNPQT